MKIKAIYYGLNDGFGIVGYGFICPSCKYANDFVDEEESEHECGKCGRLVVRVPLSHVVKESIEQ